MIPSVVRVIVAWIPSQTVSPSGVPSFPRRTDGLVARLTGSVKTKGSGVFYDPLGRPRGRSVDSIPNRFAIRRTQLSSPKGRPRCTLNRSASNSDAV